MDHGVGKTGKISKEKNYIVTVSYPKFKEICVSAKNKLEALEIVKDDIYLWDKMKGGKVEGVRRDK